MYYEATVALLERKSRAAIIHPTAIGKNDVAIRLINDNPTAWTLWLSPIWYIFKTWLEALSMWWDALMNLVQDEQWVCTRRVDTESAQCPARRDQESSADERTDCASGQHRDELGDTSGGIGGIGGIYENDLMAYDLRMVLVDCAVWME